MPVDASLISPIGLSAEAINMKNLVPDFAAQNLAQRELMLRGMQEQRLTAENATKAQRLAQYQTELVELQGITDPTKRTEAVSRFMMKWPEFSNETKGAHEVGEAGRKTARVERMGGVIEAMEFNPARAIELMEENVAANPNDTLAKQALDDFRSGDPARINAAKTFANIALSKAMGLDNYAERLGGGKPGPLEVEHKYIQRVGKEGEAEALITSKARGPLVPMMDEAGRTIGVTRLGNLPEFGAPAGKTAPTQAAPGQISGLTSQGTPVVQGPKDEATGLVTVISPNWAPGEFAYVTRSKQEFDKVPSGQNAKYYAADGKLYEKP